MKYVLTKLGEVIMFGEDVNHNSIVRREEAASAGFVTLDPEITPDGHATLAVRCGGASRTLGLFPKEGDADLIARSLGYVKSENGYERII